MLKKVKKYSGVHPFIQNHCPSESGGDLMLFDVVRTEHRHKQTKVFRREPVGSTYTVTQEVTPS